MSQTLRDLTGQKFGRLLVLRVAGKAWRSRVWECRCDCGNTVNVWTSGLTRAKGATRSCGCLQREAVIRNNSRQKATAPDPDDSPYSDAVCQLQEGGAVDWDSVHRAGAERAVLG